MKHFNMLLLLFAVFSLLLSSCDDDHSYVPTMTDVPCAVVVNQGAMGYMPGTLDVLNLTDGTYTPTVLTLGGSPQNIAECGGYLFIPLFEEDAVAVYDKSSLRAAGRIAVPAPQNVCTDGERIFAVGADSIFRISASSLSVELKDTVGHTAFAAVCSGGSVYVSIGRGMGQTEGGNLVAKVNPETLQREYISVGINPYNQMVADDEAGVFVVCTGNYYDILPAVYRIKADGTATEVCAGTYIDVCDGKLFVVERNSSYDSNWNETSSCTYKVYNANTGSLLAEDFIKADAEHPAAATFVKVNPNSGDIYVGAAGLTDGGFVNYMGSGCVCRYASDGSMLGKYEAGVSPYALYFVTKRVAE